MALNDWYELLDKQSSGPQSILNVYHVERVDVGKTASDIFDAFEFSILPSIVDLQNTGVTHDAVSVRNLEDAFDFFEATPTGNVGNRVGEGFAQFYTASIQYNRLRTDMRNGQKRIYAGVETDSTGDEWDLSFQAVLDTLGVNTVATWQVFGTPNVDVCNFGILKRVCTIEPPPDPCPSFRLPEDDSELVFYKPTSFIVRSTIRSQVSRKRLV